MLDQGSSSSRAFAISASGQITARGQKELVASFPKPGWAEYDPAALLGSQLDALDSVLAQLPEGGASIPLGIASQRSTVLLWDAQTGRCFCPAVSWQDGRALPQLAALKLDHAGLFALTGLYKTPYYSAPKIRWCLDNYPEAAKALSEGRLRIGPVTTYLLWQLSGGKVFTIEPTLAQRMLLFNIHTGDWEPRLLDAFGLTREALPQIGPSFGELLSFERSGKKLVVKACLGDQQAALSGAGGWRTGTAVINYGTGAFFLANTGSVVCKVPGLLCSSGWDCGKKGASPVYLAEGTVHAASSMFDWLAQLGLQFNKKELDSLCAQSENPVLALPALGGLGAPHWDYSVGTTFSGLAPRTTKADLLRGVVEGIAFLVSDIVLPLEKSGVLVDKLIASGGLANLDCLLQFQADILQKTVFRNSEVETTALGVAYWLASQSGIDASVWKAFSPVKEFRPSRTPEQAARLLRRWEAMREGSRALAAAVNKASI